MTALRWSLWCYVPAATLLAGVAAATVGTGTPPSPFTRDPAVVLDAHPLIGFVSNAGAVVWAAAAAIALFAALVVRRRAEAQEQERAGFLFGAGLLTLWLLLDDMFLFHDWLFPEVLGVRTRILFAVYIAVTAGLLVRYRGVIRRTPYPLLALALLGFATSVALDMLPESWFRRSDWLYLVEDGAKLFGIVGWFAYFVGLSMRALEPRPSLARANDTLVRS